MNVFMWEVLLCSPETQKYIEQRIAAEKVTYDEEYFYFWVGDFIRAVVKKGALVSLMEMGMITLEENDNG